MKIFLCCLMLGLTFLKYGSEMTSEFASTTPHLWDGREGSYTLIGGADGCPTTITLIEQCGGFTLNPRLKDVDLDTVRFCHVDKGPRFSRNDFGKVSTVTKTEDEYIRRTEVAHLGPQILPISQDLVFLNPDRLRFQWEHIVRGRGVSCLYAR
jgi:hypothetical protein